MVLGGAYSNDQGQGTFQDPYNEYHRNMMDHVDPLHVMRRQQQPGVVWREQPHEDGRSTVRERG